MITLPSLSYPYDALEPFIDEETMRIHHTKHHQAYIDKLNTLLESHPDLQTESVEQLLSKLNSLSLADKDKTILRNFGGGHSNHAFFWTILGPKKEINTDLQEKIEKKFGSVDAFKEAFTQGALSHFGSGWMWLVENKNHELELLSLPNQDSPYTNGLTPILTLDLWEHAYYLKYQNKKAEYIKNWWNIVRIV